MNILVATVEDLPSGAMIGIETDDADVLVANIDGIYYAMCNICTHMGCRLSEGTINVERVQCPCHDAIFDVRTGKVLKGLAVESEQLFHVTVENGQVFLIM